MCRQKSKLYEEKYFLWETSEKVCITGVYVSAHVFLLQFSFGSNNFALTSALPSTGTPGKKGLECEVSPSICSPLGLTNVQCQMDVLSAPPYYTLEASTPMEGTRAPRSTGWA